MSHDRAKESMEVFYTLQPILDETMFYLSASKEWIKVKNLVKETLDVMVAWEITKDPLLPPTPNLIQTFGACIYRLAYFAHRCGMDVRKMDEKDLFEPRFLLAALNTEVDESPLNDAYLNSHWKYVARMAKTADYDFVSVLEKEKPVLIQENVSAAMYDDNWRPLPLVTNVCWLPESNRIADAANAHIANKLCGSAAQLDVTERENYESAFRALLLASECGLRLSEISSLRVCDIYYGEVSMSIQCPTRQRGTGDESTIFALQDSIQRSKLSSHQLVVFDDRKNGSPAPIMDFFREIAKDQGHINAGRVLLSARGHWIRNYLRVVNNDLVRAIGVEDAPKVAARAWGFLQD